MDRVFVATVVAAVALLAGGVLAGVYLAETGAFDEPFRVDPAVTHFQATNATCGATLGNASAAAAAAADSTYLQVADNVTVDPGTALDNATLERVGLANYTLTIETGPGDAPACDGGPAVARFTATVQLPHSQNESYGVTVRYRGETVAVITNGPGAGGPVVNGTG